MRNAQFAMRNYGVTIFHTEKIEEYRGTENFFLLSLCLFFVLGASVRDKNYYTTANILTHKEIYITHELKDPKPAQATS